MAIKARSGPVIVASSSERREHGSTDERQERSRNQVGAPYFEIDDGFTMLIGANQAAIIYKIGVVDGVPAPVVVHAMRARDEFLR